MRSQTLHPAEVRIDKRKKKAYNYSTNICAKPHGAGIEIFIHILLLRSLLPYLPGGLQLFFRQRNKQNKLF